MMEISRNMPFDFSLPFFEQTGSGVMKLSATAAIDACLLAASHGLVIARVEGGIWHNPGFEARIDCIWDGADPPIDPVTAEKNNKDAAEFIKDESGAHDVFVITAPPLSGWPHRQT